MNAIGSKTDPILWIGVVLYRNSPEELKRLQLSIEGASQYPGTPAARVRFFDNSPTDELKNFFEAKSLTLDYRHSPDNLGFGGGHNVLMSEAFAGNASAYVCVNPDSLLHPACLAQLWKMAQVVKAGLVEARQFPDEHPKVYDKLTHDTPWCSGCVLLITRSCYEAIGGFDPRFFMYCEDVDLSWRARIAGLRTIFAPNAIAHHYVGDRPEGANVAPVLRSGYLLAAKYGSTDFARTCLEQMRRLGAEAEGLPPLAAPTPHKSVVDFSRLFHFAETRW